MTSVNPFLNLATDYSKKATSTGESSSVSSDYSDMQNYLNQLTQSAVTQVSEDNPDYAVEEDNTNWQEGVSTVLAGLKGLADSANQCIQSLSQGAKDHAASEPPEPTVGDTLDNAMKEFKKDPSSRDALIAATNDAVGRMNEIGEPGKEGTLIGDLSKANEDLQNEDKLFAGANEQLGELVKVMAENFARIDTANKDIKALDDALKLISVDVAENEKAQGENTKAQSANEASTDKAQGMWDAQNELKIKIDGQEVTEQTQKQQVIDEWNQCRTAAPGLANAVSQAKQAAANPNNYTTTDKDGKVTTDTAKKQQLDQAVRDAEQAEQQNKERMEALEQQITVHDKTIAQLRKDAEAAENEKTTAMGIINENASALKGLIDEAGVLKTEEAQLNDNEKNTLSKQEQTNLSLAKACQADQQLQDGEKQVQIDKKEVKKTAAEKVKENNKQIKDLQKERNSLQSKVDKAKEMLNVQPPVTPENTDGTEETDGKKKKPEEPAVA